MSPSQAHQLRNIFIVILGAIENGNLELAKQAVRRADEYLASCVSVASYSPRPT